MINNGKIIVFAFAGRKKYLEIQRHYISSLLHSHANMEYHLWNFSRNASDNEYLQELASSSPQIRIFNQFYDGDNNVTVCSKAVGVICACVKCRVGRWTEPYKYYANDPEYSDAKFVKIDDDIVFLETRAFEAFVNAIGLRKNLILSANVINNGVCAALDPRQTEILKGLQLLPASIPAYWSLCTRVEFMVAAHEYFFRQRSALLDQAHLFTMIPRSRFSINTIGFDWDVMCQIAEKLRGEASMNDEHLISANFDIAVMQGFVTCHLHFADQRASLTDAAEDEILSRYDGERVRYLESSTLET